MAALLTAQDLLGSYPVELNHAPLAGERFVAMPRVIAPLKCKKRPFHRRHFEDDVIEIGARSQQTQSAARVSPTRVQINQKAYDLRL
jgi:hypothetical protein